MLAVARVLCVRLDMGVCDLGDPLPSKQQCLVPENLGLAPTWCNLFQHWWSKIPPYVTASVHLKDTVQDASRHMPGHAKYRTASFKQLGNLLDRH